MTGMEGVHHEDDLLALARRLFILPCLNFSALNSSSIFDLVILK